MTTIEIRVPDVVTVRGTGLQIAFDPNYDRAKNDNKAQKLLTIKTASVTFESFGVTGSIAEYNNDGTIMPGLVVYDDRFEIGSAQLIYKPGQPPLPPQQAGGPLAPTALTTTTGSTTAKIRFGSIAEFDDLRIGVENFKVMFSGSVAFEGNIFIASGGAKFLQAVDFTLQSRAFAVPAQAPQRLHAFERRRRRKSGRGNSGHKLRIHCT